MVDDAPMRCQHFYCSAPGSSERTEVYVVPQDEFTRWLEQVKNIPDEGMVLHENRCI
jgi:heme/copper-type cytochrome/quinol oxidase subunit 2